MAADQEVGQHIDPYSSGASIQPEGLRSTKGGWTRNVGVRQLELFHFPIAVGKRCEADREFSIDHRVDKALSSLPRSVKGRARPLGPFRVVGCDIDKDIRIDEYQISLRVTCMTSSVV
jgi:hypothetical protein